MSQEQAETVFCVFRVIEGKEEALVELCRAHDQTLRRLGLCTEEPTALYRGSDGQSSFIFMIFQWASPKALEAAHNHPEVQRHWEAMEPLCESREGRPSMEFPHVVPVSL